MSSIIISAGETDADGNICASVEAVMRTDKSGWDIERKWLPNGLVSYHFEPIPFSPSINNKPQPMDVASIVKAWLTAHGYDGLYSDCECACLKDDLFLCSGPAHLCKPGYKVPCTCREGCDFHIEPLL